MVDHKNNSFTEYSYYHYGLTSMKIEKMQDARFALLQLLDKYPDWKQKEEANYLLANVLLEEKDTTRALSYIDQLKDKDLKRESVSMLAYYGIDLEVKNSLDELKLKLATDPENEKLAKKIAKKLNKKDNTFEEKIYLEYLIQDYQLDVEKYSKGLFKQSEKKEVYQVAVILPFNYNSKRLLGRRLRYYEMLTGIELAVDSLRKRGVNVELTVFDSKADTVTVRRILKDSKVKTADLLFGPVYEANAKIVARFALENEIAYVNPLYGNADLTFANRFVYLQSPSYSLEAEESARLGTTFENNEVIILYGAKEKDKIKADAYKKEIEKLGKKVRVMKKITKSNMNRLSDFMERNKVKALSHIYVASDNDYLGASIMSALEEFDYQCPTIAPQKWLKISLMGNDFSPYRRRNVYFVGVNHLDMDGCTRVCSFRKDIQKVWNTKPNKLEYYSAIGFESMYYFGTALNDFGNVFTKGVKNQGYTKGILFQGYDYNQHSNGVVPIYKLDKEYNLEWVNKK